MTEKQRDTSRAGIEGGVHTGSWYMVISHLMDFMRDVVPDTFPESGITLIGSLLAVVAGGATTSFRHSIKYRIKKTK